jgi:hypothetical protein
MSINPLSMAGVSTKSAAISSMTPMYNQSQTLQVHSKKTSYQNSMSRSDVNFRNANTISSGALGQPHAQNPSPATGGVAGLLNNYNSNIGESELDIEFGYCSEEESIFQSFSQDMERILPKIKRSVTLKDDQKTSKVLIKDMLKRVSCR